MAGTTYKEGIERSIRKASASTPRTIEDGIATLGGYLSDTAMDFRRVIERTVADGYSETDAIRAHWWAYDPERS